MYFGRLISKKTLSKFISLLMESGILRRSSGLICREGELND